MNKNGNGLRKNVNGTVDEQRRRSDGGGDGKEGELEKAVETSCWVPPQSEQNEVERTDALGVGQRGA